MSAAGIDFSDPIAVAALSDALANDPKVAACRRIYEEAKTMHAGGCWAGSADTARQTVEMAKAAWVQAVREAAGIADDEHEAGR